MRIYPQMNYSQAIAYLNGFANYEAQKTVPYRRFSLPRVRELFAFLKVDYKKFKAIHIAGTKGKGSTAHFCAAVLAASGYKAGLYTSPHFLDLRERIRVVDKQGAVMITRAALTSIVKSFSSRVKGGYSFFEITTALALEYFSRAGVDYLVLETGMGGRLDATNIVKPLVSVITPIAYDHTAYLGNTLGKIAYEKSGIIKARVPVVCGRQTATALAVIRKKALRLRAPLLAAGRDFDVKDVVIGSEKSRFGFTGPGVELKNMAIKSLGSYQVDNAATAIMAVSLLGCKHAPAYSDGLKKADIPYRFKIVNKKPLTLVDPAHNVFSCKALNADIKHYFKGRKVILIFACAADKDAAGMLKALECNRLILTGFAGLRGARPGDLAALAARRAQLAPGIKEAYALAKKQYRRGEIIVITGSFFLAAEFIKVYNA